MTGQEFLEKYNSEGKVTIKFTKEIDDTNAQWDEDGEDYDDEFYVKPTDTLDIFSIV